MLFPFFRPSPWTISRTSISAGFSEDRGRGRSGERTLAGLLSLPPSFPSLRVKQPLFDSKMISPRKRDELYKVVLSEAWESASHRGPGGDRPHQYPGSLAQSHGAGNRQAPCPPDFILVDGLHGVPFPSPKPIIKGDRLSHSVAGASIIAKVTVTG